MDENILTGEPISFKAETRQLLDILIHSLYKDREIFLRELISNASDALTRMSFELLTNRKVVDPQVELAIRIVPDEKENTLTITDTGIGMNREELITNLGTIAQSGARQFLDTVRQAGEEAKDAKAITDLIGQFGVGFYSAFMVADWIQVVSRSFRPEDAAASWRSTGMDTFTVGPAEKAERGTSVIVKLNSESTEFASESRLREVIRKHSDFIPYPIYIGDDQEQANRQTALWRQSPREVEEKDYQEFYQQFSLDFNEPLAHAHMVVDAPVQLYALLYIPSSPERNMFSPRREEGLKLYARKVLIQEYNKDLLPEYLGFVQGVVDSEDIPLNVSRETVQSNRVLATLKKLVTGKVFDTLQKMAEDEPEKYTQFWKAYDRYLKQGVATEQNETQAKELYPLLRFHTSAKPETWSSLDDYLGRMKPDQKEIYYILGDDERSVLYSPHLDLVKEHGYEVLLLTDPLDSFMLVRLREYQEHPLQNVANAQLEPLQKEEQTEAEESKPLSDEESNALIERFKQQLGERVADVRLTKRLSGSPARLVDQEGALNQEMQRVYRMLERDFEAPKKILELNPRHPIITGLGRLDKENPLGDLVVEQVYEDALLIEGLHPDPASMIARIQKLIEAALV